MLSLVLVAFTAIALNGASLIMAACRRRAPEVARIARHVRVRAELPAWLEEQFARADFEAWETEISSEEHRS